MKRKFLTKLFLVLLPVIFIVGVYVIKDPFKVLYHYESYYPTHGKSYIDLDKDYVSVQNFLNKYKQHPYDAFILGGSRTMNFGVQQWGEYIHSSNCYHFDAYKESLPGITKKMELIQRCHLPIKHALFAFDFELLGQGIVTDDVTCHRHPLISGESWLNYQSHFLKSFTNYDFFTAYMRLIFTGKVSKYAIRHAVLTDEWVRYDAITNEIDPVPKDSFINHNKDLFYNNPIFYERSSVATYAPQTIKDEQKAELYKIKAILDAEHTDYRIIINPLYNQLKINPQDMAVLQSIFNKDYIFDFSGINKYTRTKYNYQDVSHYRYNVATEILAIAYGQDTGTTKTAQQVQ